MPKFSRTTYASASILALSVLALTPAASAWTQPPEITVTAEDAEPHEVVEAEVISQAEPEDDEHAQQDETHVAAVEPSTAGGSGAPPEGSTPETAPLGSSGLGGTGGNGKPVKDPDKLG